MNRTPVIALLAAFALSGCGGGSSSSGRASTAAPVGSSTAPATSTSTAAAVSFRRLERGPVTGIVTTPRSAGDRRVVADAAAFAALWASHRPGAQPPAVDFAREQVAALLLGERPTSGWEIEVVGVAEVSSGAATTFEVSYRRTSPAGATTPGPTSPFDLVAIDRPAAQGGLTFRDVTPPAPARPLVQVHGELVSAPNLAGGGRTLAFLPDGAAAALEVLDVAPFAARGLHEGFTLVLDGDAVLNQTGATGLAEAVRPSAFVEDDVVTGGRVKTGFPGLAFEDAARRTWTPVGPLAAALLATPLDRPVIVTGRADPTQQTQVGPALIVTSWRPTTTVGWTATKPLLGHDELDLDDLDVTCAYRVASLDAGRGNVLETRGSGRRLDAAVAADLRARVAAAALRTLPATFQPPRLYPDHPSTTIRFADAQGDVSITIWAGATVPPALDALVTALAALPATVPTFRTIDRDATSLITTAGAETARDQNAWGALRARHAGGRPVVPAVDFAREVAVGVFDGARPSGGFEVEVTEAVRIGPHVHLIVAHRPPPGRPVAIPTAPFHFVAVDLTGATDLYVEGARQP